VPIRCPRRLRADVLAWLGTRAGENMVYVGEVEHGIRHGTLAGLGTLTEHVGNALSKGGIDLYPYRFIELRRGRAMIAKMLVSQFNREMWEAAPTMEALEVVENERRKGIATRLIGLVEAKAEEEGFDRVWGTDANLSYKLLEKLGYECDLDEECVKYLR
jgi:GNAT superfamily N-acetyltransferase